MRIHGGVLLASGLPLMFCAAALAAAVLPTPHREYLYVRHGTPAFSIHLATKSAKQLGASKARSMAFPSSGLLVLCKKTGSSPTELQMGFPGATLKLRRGHYGFSVSYTEKRAALVTFAKSGQSVAHETARATITGTVRQAKLIAGQISVTATGCHLKTSKYMATPFTPA